MILTSEGCAQHLFASQKTQQLGKIGVLEKSVRPNQLFTKEGTTFFPHMSQKNFRLFCLACHEIIGAKVPYRQTVTHL